MRALTTQEAEVIKAAGQGSRHRVKVQDSGGTLQDLTNLAGFDFVDSVDVTVSQDQPFATASIGVRRQSENFSLAKLHTTSKLNQVSGAYSALLQEGRLLIVEQCLIPPDVDPISTDWREIFRGDITDVDWAGEIIKVEAFDLGARLQRKMLEVERDYGTSPSGTAVETVMQQIIDDGHGQPYAASNAYALLDRVHPTTRNGFFYEVTVAGTSGAEPTWPTTIGNTVTSGGATFRCQGTIPTLYVPTSPVFVILKYTQKRTSVWAAIMDCVRAFGGDLRYLWRAGTSQFELTVILPNRTKTSVDFTWYPGTTDSSAVPQPSYLAIPQMASGLGDVRNAFELPYYDKTDLDASGQPKRKTVKTSDAASIAKFERQFMSVPVDATTKIDTAAEATVMINAMKDDMKDPLLVLGAIVPLFYACDLGDLYRMKANDVTHTADQDLAVVAIHHSQQGGDGQTELLFRGKPSANLNEWKKLDGGRGELSGPAQATGPAAPTGVTTSKVQGGVAISFTASDDKRVAKHELHLYTSSGTTPSSSTRKTTTDGTRFEISDLTPGVTYYGVVIAIDAKGNRGTATAEFSLAAGYTTPLSMQPQVAFGNFPPNPDFEAANTAGAPPDTWEMVTGTWATDAELDASTVYSGGNSLHIKGTGVQTKMQSQLFTVTPGTQVSLRAILRAHGNMALAGVGLTVSLQTYSDLGVTDTDGGTGGLVNVFINYPDAADAWFDRFGVNGASMIPAGSKYARIVIEKNGTQSGVEYWVDSVKVEAASMYQEKFNTVGSFSNSWVTKTAGLEPQYWLDSVGVVHLSGVIKDGTIGAVAFTLPNGYRPRRQVSAAAASSNASTGIHGECRIDTNGDVTPRIGANTSFSLDGVTFETGIYNSPL